MSFRLPSEELSAVSIPINQMNGVESVGYHLEMTAEPSMLSKKILSLSICSHPQHNSQ